MGGKEFGFAVGLGYTVREGESQILREQLLDIRTLDIVGLL